MKALVLHPFFDKVQEKTHEADDIIEVSVERFNELVKKHLIEAYEEKKAPKQA
jgi:hypothetical protein